MVGTLKMVFITYLSNMRRIYTCTIPLSFGLLISLSIGCVGGETTTNTIHYWLNNIEQNDSHLIVNVGYTGECDKVRYSIVNVSIRNKMLLLHGKSDGCKSIEELVISINKSPYCKKNKINLIITIAGDEHVLLC